MPERRFTVIAAICTAVFFMLCGCAKSGAQSKTPGYSDASTLTQSDGSGDGYGTQAQSGDGQNETPSAFIPNRTSELIRGYGTELVFRDQSNEESYLIIAEGRVIKEAPLFGKVQKMSIKIVNIDHVETVNRYDGVTIRLYDVSGQYIGFDAAKEDVEAIRRGIGRWSYGP